SSTVSEMPSNCAPSRSVVSKMSTASGLPGGRRLATSLASLIDVLQPVLVAVDLTAHGREVRLLDLLGDRPGPAQLAVVDGADRHDLGRGAGEERLVRAVEVGAQDVVDDHLEAEVERDRHDAVAGDALERSRADRRRDDRAAL